MAVINRRMQAIDLVNHAAKNLTDEKIYSALQEMALENIDNIDVFAEFVESLIKHDGNLERIVGVTHEPVDIHRFLDDDYFLGLGDQIYPEVRKAISDIINGGYVEALLMGSIGTGKSTAAQIVQAYHLYLMSCEKWPQAKFGLMPTSTIVFSMLNRSDWLAEQVTYGEFRSFMEGVPYFNEHYPFIRDKKSEMEFPKGRIKVIPSAAFNNKLLGMNIIGGVCLAGETLVTTPTGAARIDMLQSGDEIVGIKNGVPVIDHVLDAKLTGFIETFRVTFDDTSAVIATVCHPFATPDGWREVQSLHPGTIVYACPERPSSLRLMASEDVSLAHWQDVPGTEIEGQCIEISSLSGVCPSQWNDLSHLDRKRVISVEPAGIRPVYNITTHTHAFIANEIVTHNCDEMNFMQIVDRSKQSREGGEFNQAIAVYNALVRRRKSRFLNGGRLPGCICTVSSKGGPEDFTEVRAREVIAENDNMTYIWDKAQWDVVPASRFPSGKKFFIELGTERTSSRIIDMKEDALAGSKVIEVPVEMQPDFERDMEGSLRDFGGISTLSKRPFFYSRESIYNCGITWQQQGMSSPFGDIQEVVVSEDTLPEVVRSYRVMRPFAPRFIHVDLALKGDACGLACGHVANVVTVKNKGRAGELVIEDVPVVAYDTVLRLVPPRGGEIEISLVRKIIYTLRDAGLPIKIVTLDQFQSSDTQQILRRAGIRSEHLSVDGTKSKEAYSGLRSGMFDGRVLCPEHSVGFRELSQLEETDKGVIDHLVSGGKDVADAICGVYTSLMHNRSTWRAVREQGSQENKRPQPQRPLGRPRPVRPRGRILQVGEQMETGYYTERFNLDDQR